VIKKCLPTLKHVAGPETYIFAIDNGSSDDVIELLNSCPYLDDVYQSRNNLFDVLAVNMLKAKAEQLNAEYVMHVEDDFFFYDDNFLDPCIEFFDNNKQCGYIRILTYDFNNKHLYNKIAGHPDRDIANCQRHYNSISKDILVWSEKQKIGKFDFYKTNWHWYNFANICKTSIFKKIVPKGDIYPLQALEGQMMKNYHDLNLKTGVMDIGVVRHVGDFDKKTSLRLSFKNPESHNPDKQFPLITIKSINEELEFLL
tara:strand:+ start:285 stop:1052 length:768 start_codon:yes stop_codon:yes gene_type:complete